MANYCLESLPIKTRWSVASTKGDRKVVLVFSICLQPDRCEILAVVVKRNKVLNIRLEIILETDLKLFTIC